MLTGALRATLPPSMQRRPRVARFAPRAGIVETPLPASGVLRMCSRGDDEIASMLFWRGWDGHEPETVRPFYELARSSTVTMDIGAHVGYFALLASHVNPSGHVYAFEPLPRVFERLQRNVDLNAVSNVRCLPAAVGSPPGTAEFFHVKEGIPSSSSLSQTFMRSIVSDDQLTSSTVEVVEIDEFVDTNALSRVDLVKVDTETTEAAVFKGMLRTLERDRPAIFCEVLDDVVGEAIETILKPLDYEFLLLTGAGQVRREHIRPDDRWPNFLFRPRGDR